jgi:hypothetical protein
METNKTIMLILLMNNTFLISEIEEIVVDFGEPNCKLTNPFLVSGENELSSWIEEYTDVNELMISSDKILTIVEPKKTLLDKYLELTQ